MSRLELISIVLGRNIVLAMLISERLMLWHTENHEMQFRLKDAARERGE